MFEVVRRLGNTLQLHFALRRCNNNKDKVKHENLQRVVDKVLLNHGVTHFWDKKVKDAQNKLSEYRKEHSSDENSKEKKQLDKAITCANIYLKLNQTPRSERSELLAMLSNENFDADRYDKIFSTEDYSFKNLEGEPNLSQLGMRVVEELVLQNRDKLFSKDMASKLSPEKLAELRSSVENNDNYSDYDLVMRNSKLTDREKELLLEAKMMAAWLCGGQEKKYIPQTPDGLPIYRFFYKKAEDLGLTKIQQQMKAKRLEQISLPELKDVREACDTPRKAYDAAQKAFNSVDSTNEELITKASAERNAAFTRYNKAKKEYETNLELYEEYFDLFVESGKKDQATKILQTLAENDKLISSTEENSTDRKLSHICWRLHEKALENDIEIPEKFSQKLLAANLHEKSFEDVIQKIGAAQLKKDDVDLLCSMFDFLRDMKGTNKFMLEMTKLTGEKLKELGDKAKQIAQNDFKGHEKTYLGAFYLSQKFELYDEIETLLQKIAQCENLDKEQRKIVWEIYKGCLRHNNNEETQISIPDEVIENLFLAFKQSTSIDKQEQIDFQNFLRGETTKEWLSNQSADDLRELLDKLPEKLASSTIALLLNYDDSPKLVQAAAKKLADLNYKFFENPEFYFLCVDSMCPKTTDETIQEDIKKSLMEFRKKVFGYLDTEDKKREFTTKITILLEKRGDAKSAAEQEAATVLLEKRGDAKSAAEQEAATALSNMEKLSSEGW